MAASVHSLVEAQVRAKRVFPCSTRGGLVSGWAICRKWHAQPAISRMVQLGWDRLRIECLKLSQPQRGLLQSGSLTTVHDIEEAIVVLVISIDIRHQSRCTGIQTALSVAMGVPLLCWPARLCEDALAGTDGRPGRQREQALPSQLPSSSTSA